MTAYEAAQEATARLEALGVDKAHAQSSHVVCLPGLLDPEEVSAIRGLAQTLDFIDPIHPSHLIRFLHGGGLFQQSLPQVHEKLMQAVIKAGREQWGVIGEVPRVRVIEFHEYSVGGNLKEKEHYDEGSLITIDVRLSPEDAFEGGEFNTLECDGRMKEWPLERDGDAVVFLSHKYHSVQPVTSGTRNVLIMETWLGKECSSSHRCPLPDGCSGGSRSVESIEYVDLLNLDDL